ncbi:hypothetical protein KM043_015609 [Ampulex compressa]|nr:hypothetical protein KM043_015609 [Ampulex compressa]
MNETGSPLAQIVATAPRKSAFQPESFFLDRTWRPSRRGPCMLLLPSSSTQEAHTCTEGERRSVPSEHADLVVPYSNTLPQFRCTENSEKGPLESGCEYAGLEIVAEKEPSEPVQQSCNSTETRSHKIWF